MKTSKEDMVSLELFQTVITKTITDKDIALHHPVLSMKRMPEFMAMAMQFTAYILAEKIENKSATYSHFTLPWWLRWAKPFIKEDVRTITLTAWHTYPKANIAVPKLNQEVIKITKHDYSLGTENENP